MRKLMKMKILILSLLPILLFSGCTSKDKKDSITGGTTDTEVSTEAEDAEEIAITQGIESLKPVLTLDNALDLFYNTFEKEVINFEAIQLVKDDSGNYRYFIEGWDAKYNYELEVDVGTAEIIEQEMTVPVEIGDVLDLEAAITPKKAMDAALAGMNNEAVEGWKLKVDQTNRMIYEISFLSGKNQQIDALTGELQ